MRIPRGSSSMTPPYWKTNAPPRRPWLKAVEELGLAVGLGGNLFSLAGLEPAVKVLPNRSERGRIIAASWSRFLPLDALALAAATFASLAQRRGLVASASRPILRRSIGHSPAHRSSRAQDAALGLALATGVASIGLGALLLRRATREGIPLETGLRPSPEMDYRSARLQRSSAGLGLLHLAATAAALWLGAQHVERSFAG